MPDTVIRFDRQLLLALNGSDSEWLDRVFTAVTATSTWLPMAVVLLAAVWHSAGWRRTLLMALGIALVVLVADRVSSGLCKPLFHRLRPSHEPMLEGLVDLVGNRRGGLYGFFSSHAANTFGVAAFVALMLRSRAVGAVLVAWACLSSYSRIYLGLHYPGDIICGALFGMLVGWAVYRLAEAAARRACGSMAAQPLPRAEGMAVACAFILTLVAVAVAAV